MGKRKQRKSKKSHAPPSSSSNSRVILKHQSQARQFGAMEIEENETSFSHFTDKIQQQLDFFQDKHEYFSKKKSLKKNLVERNFDNQGADASQPAAHLKRDELSHDEYEPEREENLDDEPNDTNPWENPKGIVKKKPTTNSQGTIIHVQKTQQRSHGEFLRQGLKNLGNTCFCNALFQCLFDVPQFRDSILKTTKNKDQGALLRNLCDFFENLKQRSRNTQQAYSKFVKTLFHKRKDQFQIGTQGDSWILFSALLEELAIEGGSEDLPYLRIFRGGDLVKNIECSECHAKKVITETLKILNVKDLDFKTENKKNLFQSISELRVCWSCRKRGAFICRYDITEFPEILVIKVHETTNCEEKAKVIPLIEFETNNFGKVRYELLSSVVNELRGERGYHSMELSSQKENYFLVDDHREVVKVKLEDFKPEPKLLFYKKI